eukprot:Nitzschia sp. Nitz4//scaffold9_size221794//135611//140914//NITZ4_001364-RA/size221794-snap-gene-0.105-mRNA-1//1//CDS//3329561055//480//frame0
MAPYTPSKSATKSMAASVTATPSTPSTAITSTTGTPATAATISSNNHTPQTPAADPDASSVQVAVRVRPMLSHEVGNTTCIQVLKTAAHPTTHVSTVIRLGGDSGPKFTFDQVFPLSTTQHQVYQHRVEPLVHSCLEGYNATILAYGQTGSGKTHTIMGPSSSITTAVQDEEEAGVIPRAINHIFEQLQSWKQQRDQPTATVGKSTTSSETTTPTSYDYDVRVQFLEVYGEEIRDLLTSQQSNRKLSIRDVGVQEPEVVGATETKVDSAEEALLCLTRGNYRRVTGATAMNQSSSRSHAIFSLLVEQSATDRDPDGSEHVQAKRSKFNFVDLAGSERQKRTQASGQRLKEGININQGLLVLGNVISALGDPKKRGKTFVPYRDSKLTRLLKGSLGGNHKTLMVACVSPASINMEETLNCLRYANRAKNIQNRAVVNLDPTSRLLGELKRFMQLLATDLLHLRGGQPDQCTLPVELVESFAKGEVAASNAMAAAIPASPALARVVASPSNPFVSPAPNAQENKELARLRAENEAYRLKIGANAGNQGAKNSDATLEQSFLARASAYESEIASLQAKLSQMTMRPNQPTQDEDRFRTPTRPPRTPASRDTSRERSESPELNRLRAQMFGSMDASETVDAEVEAEANAVQALTTKYMAPLDEFDSSNEEEKPRTPQTPTAATLRLEAEMFELSTSISAKEELIQRLQASQEKYQAMRGFYEDRLREMEVLLSEKEHEADVLSKELQKLGADHSSSKEKADTLRRKQEELQELKRKQAELSRLTRIASKNETQISKLQNEVVGMKQKKVELQKQIASERKSHAAEIQKLKKESMQKDKELSKVKKLKDQKAMEAQKAQSVAKSRLEQVQQLKTKYKESEKKLRMQTVKRSVLEKAGLDPVMVGRRQQKSAAAKREQSEEKSKEDINVDGLRDFFDQKVAEVGRREALAEKLAQEWEEHLDLSSQRDDLRSSKSREGHENLDVLDSQIKSKEDRIRHLASRLGKRPKNMEGSQQEEFMFGADFKEQFGNVTPTSSGDVAAKVLFGMVVRERRRIASLARTASLLDEKVQAAEEAVAAKDAAFRAYVDEQRLEAAELAQNQQQHILSLMEMVQEEPNPPSSPMKGVSSPVRSAKARHAEKANTKLLLLANERIAVLERQLQETQLGRESIQKHTEREEETRALLEEKTRTCEDLEEEVGDLRSALRHIREEVSRHSDIAKDGDGTAHSTQAVLDIISTYLHPSSVTSSHRQTRSRRASLSSKEPKSPGVKIRRHADFAANTSDSDDEIPDWADDILKDLAIIADGKMPSSLKESPDVIQAEAQLENPSVFDRLTNPDSFTGVQKQKKLIQKQNRRVRVGDPTAEGQRHRKMISKQVKENLEKLVIPGDDNNSTSTSSSHQHQKRSNSSMKERPSDHDDGKKRSVFDRLLSPSNMTGTQKQRYQEQHEKRDHSGTHLDWESSHIGDERVKSQSSTSSTTGRDADELLGELLKNSDSESSGKKAAPPVPAKSHLGSSSKKDNHKDLDVFERLNRTTTQAYAVKQHVNIAEKMLGDLLDKSERQEDDPHPKPDHSKSDHSKGDKATPHFERVEEYMQQNVFERLQKTTTRAYAVKQHNHTSDKSDDRKETSPRLCPSSPSSKVPSPSRGKDDGSHLRSSAASTGSFNGENGTPQKLTYKSGSHDAVSMSEPSPISSRLRPRRTQEE